ncbi:hypothetical protein SOVF_195250, partial [Spinacia oleracea]
MCEKNCCNHTHHAIFFFFLLSLLLLLNASNINLFNHSTRPSHGAKAGENDAGSPSPPCGTTGTTKMVMAFLYGALFTLILTIVTNNSGLSSPKHNDERAAYSGAGPSDRTTFTRSIVDDDEVVEGGGVGVGFALLRTFPTFAYSVRRPPKMGKGSPFCVVCQSKFRDGELRPDPVPDQPGRGGLDPAILVAFPVFTYSDVEGLGLTKGPLGPVECAVCLSPFEEKDTLRLLSKCYHVFHLHCVDRWLAAHTTCPLCRANLVTLPGETSRVESGSVDESGSIILSGVAAVESDHTPEGKFIGKIWRWNSTGHLTEIGWEEGE